MEVKACDGGRLGCGGCGGAGVADKMGRWPWEPLPLPEAAVCRRESEDGVLPVWGRSFPIEVEAF